MIRDIEQDDGVLIFFQEKPYTDENDLICWHYDHSQNRTVKGINLLNCVYHASDVSLPVTYELQTGPLYRCEDPSRQAQEPGHDLAGHVVCLQASDKISLCIGVLCKGKLAVYSQQLSTSLSQYNRTVLSYEDKRDRFARIDAQNLTEDFMDKRIRFSCLLIRQVFTNKDESTGEMFLACSDLTCDGETIETIYQKRWKVETFHKTLKYAALSKSPTRRVRTQSNHCFMAIYAAALEGLRVKHQLILPSGQDSISRPLCELQFLKLRNISY